MKNICLECGKPLTGKQIKFCCAICKARWWNKQREQKVKGFEILKQAFEKVQAGLN